MIIAFLLLAATAAADVPRQAPGECDPGSYEGAACTLDDGATGACERSRCSDRRAPNPFRDDARPVIRTRNGLKSGERNCLRCLPGTPRDRADSTSALENRGLPPIVYIVGGVALLGIIAGGVLVLTRKKTPPPAAATPPASDDEKPPAASA